RGGALMNVPPCRCQPTWTTVIGPIHAFVCILVMFAFCLTSQAQSNNTAASFLEQVDVSSLQKLAVHTDGRFNSLESFTRSMLKDIAGPHEFPGRSEVAGYLDLLARPQAYENAAVVYVKNKSVRGEIIDALVRDGLA